MIRRPPRSTLDRSSAASDVYKRQAYQYAKLGEAAILPEEAQEAGTHNVDRESLHQRKQVLESCLAQLELRKATRAGRDWRRTLGERIDGHTAVSYTHLRAHETVLDLVCRLLLEKKTKKPKKLKSNSR